MAPMLACPRCKAGLVEAEGFYRCTSPECIFSAVERFPVVGRWPVLVDFERSIVQWEAFESSNAVLPRPRRIGRWHVDDLPLRLRSWWKPRNEVAARNVEMMLSLLPGRSPIVLVIGGATIGNGVEALYADDRISIVAFDIYCSAMTQFVADAHQIPLSSESIDAVVIQAVLEHVLDPNQVVSEIRRVLRPGGMVYAETPFLQQVHAGPYDFVRYTSSGHRYLFRRFDEISAGPVAGPGTQMLWSVDHLVRGLFRSQMAGRIARGVFFWLRSLDRLVPTSFSLDSASAHYFLGRRSDQELTPHEIVSYYHGAQVPSAAPSFTCRPDDLSSVRVRGKHFTTRAPDH
jgi:SAM-dependent methyltransferase